MLNTIVCTNRSDRFDNFTITVDGRLLTPERSQKLRNHSPDGFSWGYGGSGPAQLALAILLECGVDDNRAMFVYQDFKFAFIANLPQDDSWSMSIDVKGWVDRKMEERRMTAAARGIA